MAKNRFTFISYTEDFKDYNSLIEALDNLSFELKGTNLHNLSSFIEAYTVILKNTVDKISDDYYENSDLVTQIDLKQAHSFFSALKNYVNRETCPFVWKECFEQCEQENTWEFVYMSMAFNAQINYDLIFTLRNTLSNTDFKSDYIKIYDIVTECTKEIIRKIHGDILPSDKTGKKLLTIYSIFFNVIYHRWEESAWENFINLKAGYIRPKYIEKSSQDILKQIIGIHYFRQYFSKGLSKLEVFQTNQNFIS